MNTQNKTKNCIAKLLHKKYPVLRFEPSPLTAAAAVTAPHTNSSHAFTMLLSSEVRDTLVIQRDFYTSIIVIVAFDADIEAGSINYLPYYIVLHARLYTIARR